MRAVKQRCLTCYTLVYIAQFPGFTSFSNYFTTDSTIRAVLQVANMALPGLFFYFKIHFVDVFSHIGIEPIPVLPVLETRQVGFFYLVTL